MLFRPEKWSSSKVKNNCLFAKGSVHGFCKQIDLFLICFFGEKKATNKQFFIFWIEKNAFQTWGVKFSQSRENRHFAKGLFNSFCQKATFFLYVFFFAKRKKQTVSYILDRKECFLSKIDLFLLCFFFWAKKARNKQFLIFWKIKNVF